MSSGHIVCNGAICQCKNGFAPDKLKVISAPDQYVNDANGSSKLAASTMELGVPFEKGSFGQCKLQPNGSSYNPCIPNIVKWKDYYKNVTLSNNGQVLTEKSKGICAIAGAPCVEFITHGQQPAISNNDINDGNDTVQNQINPLVNPKDLSKIGPFDNITLS